MGDKVTRRDFLKTTGAVALAAGALGGAALPAWGAEIKKRQLGRTKLMVTELGLGGTRCEDSAVVQEAINQGITLVHTAPGYAHNNNLKAVGEVMKTMRDKVALCLKGDPDPNNIRTQLQVLNAKKVDVVTPNAHNLQAIENPALREGFEASKKEGLVDWLGFSCHGAVPDVLAKAVELGYFDCALIKYFPGNKAQLDPILEQAQKIGMGILVMKWRTGASDIPTALNTVLGQPAASCALGSCATVQDVGNFVGMAQAGLPADFEERSRRMIAEQERTTCAGCGKCGVCPRNVAVSDILRFRMYAEEYGDWDMGRQGYRTLASAQCASNCDDCGLCEQVCSHGLPIRQRLREAHRMLTA